MVIECGVWLSFEVPVQAAAQHFDQACRDPDSQITTSIVASLKQKNTIRGILSQSAGKNAA
jgi:hypothetical protein